MKDLKVGVLGYCGLPEFERHLGGRIIHSVDRAELADILVFSGGEDINPWIYGEENRYGSFINTVRDNLELRVLKMAIRTGKKILGICRGHQLVNAVLGGSLYQDIRRDTGKDHDRIADEYGNFLRVHSFGNEPFWKNEELGKIFQTVNSLHHQAVKEPGKGLDVILRARDGIIESTASNDGRIVTFQFHPEWLASGPSYFERVLETGQLIW